MSIHPKDILIKDLFESYELSVRAYHICESADIVSILDLHNFITKHNNFMSVRTCGKKTNDEIFEVHKKYYSEEAVLSHLKSQKQAERNNKTKIIPDSHFELLIKSEYEKLGVRAKNALMNFFDNKFPSMETFSEIFIEHKFNPKKLRNIGAKTEKEINQFVSSAVSILNQIENYEINPNELARVKFEGLMGIKLKEDYLIERFEQKQFPILTFVAHYLQELLDLDELETVVLNNYFGHLEKHLSFQEIGDEFDLTRERVRQKSERLLERFCASIGKIKILLDYSDYRNYFLQLPALNVLGDIPPSKFRDEIEKNGYSFSCYALEILFPEYYKLTQSEHIERPENIYDHELWSKLKTIKNNYLIQKTTIQKAKLLSIYKKLVGEICRRNEEQRNIPISKYLKGVSNEESFKSVLHILRNELGEFISNNELVIKRNTPKLVYEYVYEALKSIGKPSHVSKILEEILRTSPEYDANETSVRAAVIKYKEVFISFGRTSTFGLKEWESKYENIKGGTIRNIVEEFLELYDEPCHISDITEYVNKYRKTDEKSVLTNLKLTSDKRFSFFYGAYVGLSEKNYQKLNVGKKYNYKEVSLDSLMADIFSK